MTDHETKPEAPELEGELSEESKARLTAAVNAALLQGEKRRAELIEAAQTLATSPIMQDLFQSEKALNDLRQAYNNVMRSSIAAAAEDFSAAMAELSKKLVIAMQDTLPALAFITDVYDLEPYLWPELQRLDPELSETTFNMYLDRFTVSELMELSQDLDSDFSRALDAAKKAKAAAETVTTKRAENIEYPIDKPNSEIWNLFSEDPSGQLRYMIDMLPDKPKTAGTLYTINFDALSNDMQISKRLEPYDKRAYIATAALFNANKDSQDKAIISVSQIYYAMGYTGKPGAEDRDKINNSLTKMTSARIFIDNESEANQLPGYPHFRYDASLLPMERITISVNGQTTETAIKLLREPPMITFAKERRQVTTIPVELLQSPNSKTNANLQIEDYLLERISKAKNAAKKADAKNKKKAPAEHTVKIMLQTLYQRAEITTKKQIQRAPAKIDKYLKHLQKLGYIKRYTMEPNDKKPEHIIIAF